MNETTFGPVKAPWHFWLIGVLGLLWNGFGAWDYLQSKLENRDYLAMNAEPLGVSVDTVIAYFAAYPLWANIAWGFGVWGAVAGSIMLVLRSRYASYAFLIALVGLVVSMIRGFANPMPGVSDFSSLYVFSSLIFALLFCQFVYARRMAAAGLLR